MFFKVKNWFQSDDDDVTSKEGTRLEKQEFVLEDLDLNLGPFTSKCTCTCKCDGDVKNGQEILQNFQENIQELDLASDNTDSSEDNSK